MARPRSTLRRVLHLLHNNAADVVIIQRDSDVVNMDVEVWDRTMAVNLRGPMLGCKHAIPHMIEAGGGAIVTTSSTSGQFGDLSRAAYGVSKAGIDSLTRYVATLYGKQDIRANAVAPGVVKTPSLAANVTARGAGAVRAQPRDARAWASRTTSPRSSPSCCPTPPPTSPVRSSTSTAACTMHTPLYGEQIAQR